MQQKMVYSLFPKLRFEIDYNDKLTVSCLFESCNRKPGLKRQGQKCTDIDRSKLGCTSGGAWFLNIILASERRNTDVFAFVCPTRKNSCLRNELSDVL